MLSMAQARGFSGDVGGTPLRERLRAVPPPSGWGAGPTSDKYRTIRPISSRPRVRTRQSRRLFGALAGAPAFIPIAEARGLQPGGSLTGPSQGQEGRLIRATPPWLNAWSAY